MSLAMDRFPRFSRNVGVTMEVARISHRLFDQSSIDPGQRAYNSNDTRIPPSANGLRNLKETKKLGMKEDALVILKMSGFTPY